MPYSDVIFDKEIIDFIKMHPEKHYLDIGIGAGKYGKFIKENNSSCSVDGIEIEKDYIKKFKLKNVYDRIYNISVDNFIDKYPDNIYDVCIIGDCIEHLRKSCGIDLLNFLVYRTKYIIIKFPERYIQNSWEGYKHEAHISIWSEKDFSGFDFKIKKRNSMYMVIIKGYLK